MKWVMAITAASALNNELAVLVADALCDAINLGLSRRFNTSGYASTVTPAWEQLPPRTPANYIFSTDKWDEHADKWSRPETAPKFWSAYWERGLPEGLREGAYKEACARRCFLSRHPDHVLWDSSKGQMDLSLPPRIPMTGSRKRSVSRDAHHKLQDALMSPKNFPVDAINLPSVMATAVIGAENVAARNGGSAPEVLKKTACSAAAFLVGAGFDVMAMVKDSFPPVLGPAPKKRGITNTQRDALLHAYDRLSPSDDGFVDDRNERDLHLWKRFGAVPGHICLLEHVEIPDIKTGEAQRCGDWIHYELRLNCMVDPDMPGAVMRPDFLLRDPSDCTSVSQMLSTAWSDVMPGHMLDMGADTNGQHPNPNFDTEEPGGILIELTREQFHTWARLEWVCGAKLLGKAKCDEHSMNGPLVRSIAERYHSQLNVPDNETERPSLLVVRVPRDMEVVVCEYAPDLTAEEEREHREISDEHYARVASLLGLEDGLGQDLQRLRLGSLDDLREGAKFVPVLEMGHREGIYLDASNKYSGWTIEVKLKYAVVVRWGPGNVGDLSRTQFLEKERRAKRENGLKRWKRVVAVVLLLRRWRFSAPLQSSYRQFMATLVPLPIRRCVHKAIERAFEMAECRWLEAKRAEEEAREAAGARVEKELRTRS